MSQYMLIQVAEGEILEKIYPSLEKAQEAMRKRTQVCCSNFEEYVEEGNASVGEMVAYIMDGKNHDNYSWKIVEISSEEKSISEMTTEEILKQLTSNQKDDIYRALWQKHVENDVQFQAIEAFDVSLDQTTVENIANRYVYGDYDCNLSYWTNIESLIREYLND